MLNKIYRGGVHKTTPETTEVKSDAALLAGNVVQLDGNNKAVKQAISGKNEFVYVVGEKLHHGIDQVQGTDGDSVRLYVPKSGDLFAVRAAAGVNIQNDMPLAVNSDGRAIESTAEVNFSEGTASVFTATGGQDLDADLSGAPLVANISDGTNTTLDFSLNGAGKAANLLIINNALDAAGIKAVASEGAAGVLVITESVVDTIYHAVSFTVGGTDGETLAGSGSTTVGTAGVKASSATVTFAYVDLQEHGSLEGGVTAEDDLIPVKFK